MVHRHTSNGVLFLFSIVFPLFERGKDQPLLLLDDSFK